MLMVTKLVKVVKCCKELTFITLNDPSMKWFCRKPIDTKMSQVQTYHDLLPPLFAT